MRLCRDCGGQLGADYRPDWRWRCHECHNAYKRRMEQARLARTRPERGWVVPVADPVRYGLTLMMERALLDLKAIGKPLPPQRWQDDTVEDGVTDIVTGCDCDAQDALRWLEEFGADFCELLDVPREWAAMETDARLRRATDAE